MRAKRLRVSVEMFLTLMKEDRGQARLVKVLQHPLPDDVSVARVGYDATGWLHLTLVSDSWPDVLNSQPIPDVETPIFEHATQPIGPLAYSPIQLAEHVLCAVGDATHEHRHDPENEQQIHAAQAFIDALADAGLVLERNRYGQIDGIRLAPGGVTRPHSSTVISSPRP